MASSDSLPIDIHYGKLLDWLIDRKKVPKNWHTIVRDARALIDNLLAQIHDAKLDHEDGTNENKVADLLKTKRYLDYFALKELMAAAEQHTKAEKDLFGRYKSDLMKSFVEVLKLYEQQDAYLAECAQILIRNTDIEIVLLKRKITRLQTTVSDSVRKEPELQASSETAMQQYRSMCAALGLTPDSEETMVSMLRRRTNEEFPRVMACACEFAHNNQNLVSALDLYKAFIDVADVNVLTALQLVVQEGPKVAYKKSHFSTETSQGAAQGTIDWGLDMDANLAPPSTGNKDTGDIDWGGFDMSAVEEVAPSTTESNTQTEAKVPVGSDGGGIDWGGFDITATSDANALDMANASTDQAIEADGHTMVVDLSLEMDIYGDVLRHEEAISEPNQYMEDGAFRAQYLNDLYELGYFLNQRLWIVSSGRQSYDIHGKKVNEGTGKPLASLEFLSAAMIQSAKPSSEPQTSSTLGREHTPEGLVAFLETVSDAISCIESKDNRQWIQFMKSEKFMKRTAQSIDAQRRLSDKLGSMVESGKDRRNASKIELAESQAQLNALIQATLGLKKQVEQAISHMFQNRPVNLIGDINLGRTLCCGTEEHRS